MAPLARCPRCDSARLSVIYYDAEGKPLGGHVECCECGPRHAEPIAEAEATAVQRRLLERKAS